VLAQSGEVIENKEGTFLVLSKGNMQRHEVGRPDPKMVSFDRYGFDLSQYVGGPAAIKYGIRERYLWQLLFPDPKEPMYIEQPGQFRAELHDRLMAPLYPIAFVIIAFAYLGAPRTNRQSRAMSLLGAVGGVALLRLIGFASIVFGANQPWMLSLQYMALALTFGLGLYVISSGLILEPPAFLTNALDALSRHISRRFASG
jgi:lipopolysaccharide export system permease protein